jgi:hypothetical protein
MVSATYTPQMRKGWVGALVLLTTAVAVPRGDAVLATAPGNVPTLITTGSTFVAGLSNDGHRALVVSLDTGASTLVDSVTGDTFAMPFAGNALLARDGRSVLISTTISHKAADTDTNSDIYEWFPDTNATVLRTAGGASNTDYTAVSMSLDGSVLFARAFSLSNLTQDVVMFDNGAPVSLTPILGAVSRFTTSDDGRRLIYLSAFGTALSVFDRPSQTIIPLESGSGIGSVGQAFTISGDGNTVAYAFDNTFPIFEPGDFTFPVPPAAPNETFRYVVRKVDSLFTRVVGDVSGPDATVALNSDATRVAFTTKNDQGVTQAVIEDLGQPGLRTVSRTAAADANADVTTLAMSAGGTTAAFTTTATNIATTGSGAHAFWTTLPPPITAGLVALAPARLLDTRTGQLPTVDGQFSGIGKNVGHNTLALTVSGRGGVPADAAGVMLNVTITEPDAVGFATVFPCGQPLPTTSNLNFAAGATVANNVFTALGDGAVCIHTNVDAHIVVDVNAYAIAGTGFTAISPKRMLDTRVVDAPTVDGRYSAGGRRPAGFVTVFAVGGRSGVESRGGAYFLTVTAVDPATAGFLTVYPCAAQRPLASSLNFDAHQTVANTVVVKPGTPTFEDPIPVLSGLPGVPGVPQGPPMVFGNICVFTSAPTDIIADVNGFIFPRGLYSPALRQPIDSTYIPLTPSRLLETRPGQPPTIDGQSSGIGSLATGTETRLAVVGRAGVPVTASAVVLNITSTASTRAGFVTVYPCGGERPTTSNLNYSSGQTIANNVTAKLGASGSVCLFNSSATDLIVDLGGYVSIDPPDECYVCVIASDNP